MSEAATDRLIEAMHADPVRAWTPNEAADYMGIPHKRVHSHLNRAIETGRIIRNSGGRGRTTFTLGTGLVDMKPGPRNGEPRGKLPDLAVPRFIPAPMVPPRPGTEVRAVSKPPPGMCAGCSKADCWDHGCQKRAGAAAPAAAPEPPAEPPAHAVEPPDEPQDESDAVDFDAFLSARDGSLQIIGAEIDEEGRVHLTGEQWSMLKRRFAWSPA